MLDCVEYIKKNNLGVVYINKTFRELTTIRVGGNIKILYYPNTLENFIIFYKNYLLKKKYKFFILGNGSNVLASDEDFNGVVVSFKKMLFKYSLFNNVCTVSSGVLINDVIHYLKEYNLGGLEKLYYIPATIGGLIKMNAGAYDYNISDSLISIKTINEKGEIKVYKKEDINFEYRKTNINEIIVESSFLVENIKKCEIVNKIKGIKIDRINKYPLNQYNAGSTFKNPNGYKSWELINNLGLRGININDALVSDKHCNFLVNKNNCRSDDMKKLIELIINTVKNEYNIKLECEWDLINF